MKIYHHIFFALGIVISALSSLSAQTPLITNGDFSGGSSKWYLGQYGGSSSGSVTGGEYQIIVTTAGSEHWHVQFTQSGLPLVQGTTYIFSFDAYKGPQNSSIQRMQVNIGQRHSPYTSYFGSQDMMCTLTTTKKRFTYIIDMTNTSDQDARVEFNCGKSSGGFYIDNVSLVAQGTAAGLLNAAPLHIDYGSITAGSLRSINVTLHNSGSTVTTVNDVQSSSGSFTVDCEVPATIPSAGSVNLPVTFAPSSPGNYSGTVTILSDASDNPTISLDLNGTATLSGIGVSPEALEFSSPPDEMISQVLTLSNTGTSPITWTMESNTSWALVSPTSGTIPPGSEVTCIVTAGTGSTGSYTGTITLLHSASNQPSPLTVALSLIVTEGYQPTSEFLQHPELAIDFIRDIAAFRMKQHDNSNGGFYTDINRQGYSTASNIKALCGQSRIAYAFVRAFMVTGDEQYLEYAHHALAFLYKYGWNNGWYFVTDSSGNHISHWGHDNWWSFQQHYALVGITAMVEATGGTMEWNDGSESDLTWLMRGVNSNYTKLWDANSPTKGYYNYANTTWTNKWGKGFTPTVDGVTTHALHLALMYDSVKHHQRLADLADNIVEHMVGNMAVAGAGFPETFTSDWSIDYGSTSMDIGHGYKTAWVLQRAYLCNLDHPEYRTGAQALMQDLWEHGCYDSVNGAPYSYVDWQSGKITSTNKDFWMTEQGFTAGLISYYTATLPAQRDMYLRVADGSINFFMNHHMDPVYGEAYAVVNQDGSAVVDASKGGLFTAGYHSSELGYYAYLYGSLYYHHSPVDLYYYYPEESHDRSFRLTPLAIEDEILKITAVTLDGATYTDFDPETRTIHLPVGIGGKFKVTFGFTARPTYTITATAGPGGSISPTGVLAVNQQLNRSFTINPEHGYAISAVIIDGTPFDPVSEYTFLSVTENHTIKAEFTPVPTITITATTSGGGTISPSGTVAIEEGTSITFTATPADGYMLSTLLVDGTIMINGSTYTFTNISANHTISAAFSQLSIPATTINCGGSTATPFTADAYFSGGTARTITNSIDRSGVIDPAPQVVYQSERYGNMTYTLTDLVAGASYTVRLHFAETYWNASGKRRFNVAINGSTVLSNYDIYAATGARYKAVAKEYSAIANSSGQIELRFTTMTDNATIEGIEVISK